MSPRSFDDLRDNGDRDAAGASTAGGTVETGGVHAGDDTTEGTGAGTVSTTPAGSARAGSPQPAPLPAGRAQDSSEQDDSLPHENQQRSGEPTGRTRGRRAAARANLLNLALSLLCAGGLTAAFLPWGSLTRSSEHTAPVLLCAVLVALCSNLLRTLGAGTWISVPVTLLVGLTVPLNLAGAGPLPLQDDLAALADALAGDVSAVQQFSVPIPAEGGSLSVLVTVLALVLALVLEVCVVGRGWVALGGFVLLVVHVLPSNFGAPTSAADFALAAAFFVGMLAVGQARDSRAQAPGSPGRLRALGVRVPAALTVGASAVLAACLVTTLTPLPDAPPWNGNRSGSSDEEVTIANPLLDLRRDLTRGADVDLLTVTGTRRMPRYVRTAVLTEYDGRQWTTGDRRASGSQRADGVMSDVLGLDQDTPVAESEWTFQAKERFRSRWLPLPEHASTVDAEGDWRYDITTRDFVAWDSELTTSALRWSASTRVPEVPAEALDDASNALPADGKRWVRLPDGMPDLVEELAEEVAGDAPTRFRQAKALQSWFRSEFTYSLDVVESVGDDDLVSFLSPEGREGYCEQFAASMALMARALDIPARVVVGFLEPERVNRDTYVFSAHDLHAWPELYFEGTGWVRFEPTPGSRAEGVPSYTRTPLDGEDDFDLPTESPSASQAPSSAPTTAPSESTAPEAGADEAGSSSTTVGSGPFLVVGVLLALLASAAVPALVRRRRRAERLSSTDPERWWEELRGSVVDLGGQWPTGRSPQETRAWLLTSGLRPDPEALDVVVRSVELTRYAPSSISGMDAPAARPADLAGGRDEGSKHPAQQAAHTLVLGLGSGLPLSRRLLARAVPRSLFTR